MNILSLPLLARTLAAVAWADTPTMVTPAVFRDTPTDPANHPNLWKTAAPADTFARGAWWNLFNDPTLDDLIVRALAANQDLRGAAARVEQARASAGLAQSNLWPQIAAHGAGVREQTSATTDNVFPDTLTTSIRTPLTISWELDLFGRVRHLNASARAEAEASAATFESVRLALTTEVAATYFSLRALDHELSLVRDGIGLRRRARDLAQSRFAHGLATELDVVRAEAEVATTEAELAALANRRASHQNALSVLLGAPAPDFVVTTASIEHTAPPLVPPGLPSDLLERRPDIAAAERALAAATARIGVARAAFFPAISLTGSAGYASGEIDQLFRVDSRVWSFGPSLYLPIFQGGRNRAQLQRSSAAYAEAIASYRQRVLVAFREVQDALTAMRLSRSNRPLRNGRWWRPAARWNSPKRVTTPAWFRFSK